MSRPESWKALQNLVVSGQEPSYISRGLGRAYGDAALNGDRGVIVHTRLNHFLGFDEQTGILECEAGVSLAEIIEYFLPRGWFPPTTPGTKYVTIGGAIAADVHGKNHHRVGTFGNFVLDLRLLIADGTILECSPTKHADVFWATVGGMGLTGVILSARLQLRAVETAYYDVRHQRTANLDETIEAFSESDRNHGYTMAWIDCLARGKNLGRSVMMLGNEATVDNLPRSLRDRPLHLRSLRKSNVPCHFPSFVLNSWTVKAFNALYYRRHPDSTQILDYDTFFFPLDRVLQWNRIYGRRGFVQYQALFPAHNSREGLIELLQRISRSRRGSFLAVLKTCGPAGPGLLSFPYAGHTLALDFPNTGADLQPFLRELDEILLKYGGRLYLAKDAMATADTFTAMYPRLDEFRQIKARIDPHQRFTSSQARRLGIVPPETSALFDSSSAAPVVKPDLHEGAWDTRARSLDGRTHEMIEVP